MTSDALQQAATIVLQNVRQWPMHLLDQKVSVAGLAGEEPFKATFHGFLEEPSGGYMAIVRKAGTSEVRAVHPSRIERVEG